MVGKRGKGRPEKTWDNVIQDDLTGLKELKVLLHGFSCALLRLLVHASKMKNRAPYLK